MEKRELNSFLESFDGICKAISESRENNAYMKNIAYRLLTYARGNSRDQIYDTLLRMALDSGIPEKKQFTDLLHGLYSDAWSLSFDQIKYDIIGKVIKYS